MVDGLRARLEQSPDDPKGWALLAQSYAFMGDREGAEAALARAVALGMNEPELRQRIEAAAPASPPPTDWVQQALNR
jgi:cytochrome c-type biogenesis protein CcmH